MTFKKEEIEIEIYDGNRDMIEDRVMYQLGRAEFEKQSIEIYYSTCYDPGYDGGSIRHSVLTIRKPSKTVSRIGST